jgi:D-beta-D-heptose 7-phosphate kinase/D-beta-D-heptose 1-phosphate adenosyltransferase
VSPVTPDIVDAFRSRRVVVIGDALLDRFTDAHAERWCREGPAPMVRVDEVRSRPGGAANVAANLATLGAAVELVSVVGEDAPGDELVAALDELNVGVTRVVQDPAWSTPLLNRVRADGQLLVRVDEGTDGAGGDPAPPLGPLVTEAAAAADAVVVSDYARGAVGPAVLDAVARLRGGPLVAVDAHHLARYRPLRPEVVTPNWSEVLPLLVLGPDGRDRAAFVASHAGTILRRTGARVAAVTLDRDGAVLLERGRPPHRTFTRPTTEDRATGAGDTFLAALTLALTSGLPTPAAGDLAALAAGIVVSDRVTGQCGADALAAAIESAAPAPARAPAPAPFPSAAAGS